MVEEPTPRAAEPAVVAAMWRIAADLTWHIPHSGLFGILVPGKVYLAVATAPTDHVVAAIEPREHGALPVHDGGVHVLQRDLSEAIAGHTGDIVRRTLTQLGVDTARTAGPRADAIAYRTIAAILSARIFDDAHWRTEQLFADWAESSYPVLPRWAPVAHIAAHQGTGPETTRRPWVVHRDSQPVAVFAGGHAWASNGLHLDLAAAFAAGASFGDLCAQLTHRHRPPGVLITVPPAGADHYEIVAFAGTYDGYARWAREVPTLANAVRPVLNALQRGQLEPFGVDALRAALFFLVRAQRFNDDPTGPAQMAAIVDHLRDRFGPVIPAAGH